MYIPAWAGLSPAHLFHANGGKELPFPFDGPGGIYFYRARNAIYHLFRSLKFERGMTVLVPAYHSGSEVLAIRAAGASIRYYSIHRNLEPDLDELRRLCATAPRPRGLYVIHYMGWPQPIKEITALCREHGLILIEDCALSLFSETGGRPLGRFGDYAVFCLYKTLPVPNGGLLVQNGTLLEDLARLEFDACSTLSVVGRSLELVLERIRGRSDRLGASLMWQKRAAGRALSAIGVKRLPVGEIGFDPASVNIGISRFSLDLLKRFDPVGIHRMRRENFMRMLGKLAGRATVLRRDLEEGVCPLFFPILVADKTSAARALWRRGVGAIEFWNDGDPEATREAYPDAHFLRDHVLELPIHQDITPAQVDYTAEQVLKLRLQI